MYQRKHLFDIAFIIVSTAILLVLVRWDLLEKYIGFSLIPVLIAYQLGKFTQRKFGEK